jgi:hypothetical protein
MPNRILRGQEIHSDKIGVNQDNPVHSIDVSGDIYSDRYVFGGDSVEHLNSQVINFDGKAFQSLSLTGDLSLSTTNRCVDTNKIKSTTVRIIGDTVDRNLTFSSSIKFIGDTPLKLRANKVGVLSLNSFGINEADTVAAYRAESEGLVNIPNNTVLLNRDDNIVGDTRFYVDFNTVNTSPLNVHLSGNFYSTASGVYNVGSKSGCFDGMYSDNFYTRGKNIANLPYSNDMWTGDGNIDRWVMTNEVTHEREIMVMVDGLVSVPVNDYTVNNLTGLVFDTSPANSKVIDVRYF